LGRTERAAAASLPNRCLNSRPRVGWHSRGPLLGGIDPERFARRARGPAIGEYEVRRERTAETCSARCAVLPLRHGGALRRPVQRCVASRPNRARFSRRRHLRFPGSCRLLVAPAVASTVWSRTSAPTGNEACGRSTRRRCWICSKAALCSSPAGNVGVEQQRAARPDPPAPRRPPRALDGDPGHPRLLCAEAVGHSVVCG
jgi:hypothetical protein